VKVIITATNEDCEILDRIEVDVKEPKISIVEGDTYFADGELYVGKQGND
jgi:hypothetical protein